MDPVREKNKAVFNDTWKILERGYYEIGGKRIPLKLTREQMEEAEVFLPEDVRAVCENKDFPHIHVLGRCG